MGNRSTTRRRRHGRISLAALAAGAVIAAFPATAWGHPTFSSSESVPADSDQKLVFKVGEEKGPDVHNSKVQFVVPAGFRVAGCDRKPNWECAVSGASNGRNVVTFTRTSGNEKDELFGFDVRTPGKPGDYSIPTNQSYGDNTTSRWSGPPDSENPAPVLKVT